ncbi:FecR domain-containing protein [Trichocoleus sp. FACHB-40]|nr:FecR domain-containing protein [Trichocoleus sp. FACHB-40]
MNLSFLNFIFQPHSQQPKINSFIYFALICLTSNFLGVQKPSFAIQEIRVNRWLEVRQMIGNVIYYQGSKSFAARVGTRLQNVGDAIETGAKSSAVIAVDTEMGVINVSEKTTVRVQELHSTGDGGRVTRLQVTGGQVRLRLVPFTNPGSQLEIQTPAGVSAVRGTEFGVIVHPDGKTGVATREGKVLTISQGKGVLVGAGYSILMIPGQAPSPPVAMTGDVGDASLKLQLLTTEANQMARITGKVEATNLVSIADTPVATNLNGQFDVKVPIPFDRRIEAVVTTPLGKRQVYELAVP